jgi:hypothetical protein
MKVKGDRIFLWTQLTSIRFKDEFYPLLELCFPSRILLFSLGLLVTSILEVPLLVSFSAALQTMPLTPIRFCSIETKLGSQLLLFAHVAYFIHVVIIPNKTKYAIVASPPGLEPRFPVFKPMFSLLQIGYYPTRVIKSFQIIPFLAAIKLQRDV